MVMAIDTYGVAEEIEYMSLAGQDQRWMTQAAKDRFTYLQFQRANHPTVTVYGPDNAPMYSAQENDRSIANQRLALNIPAYAAPTSATAPYVQPGTQVQIQGQWRPSAQAILSPAMPPVTPVMTPQAPSPAALTAPSLPIPNLVKNQTMVNNALAKLGQAQVLLDKARRAAIDVSAIQPQVDELIALLNGMKQHLLQG